MKQPSLTITILYIYDASSFFCLCCLQAYGPQRFTLEKSFSFFFSLLDKLWNNWNQLATKVVNFPICHNSAHLLLDIFVVVLKKNTSEGCILFSLQKKLWYIFWGEVEIYWSTKFKLVVLLYLSGQNESGANKHLMLRILDRWYSLAHLAGCER